MRVLLVSPVDPDVPSDLKFLMGGESTYTKTLLSNPPRNVEYVHHLQALKDGSVEYLSLQGILRFLVKFRILPLAGGSQCFKIKGDFDLVHCHGYSLKMSGKNIPVILSDSSSNYLFLRDYVNWSEWRINLGYFFRRYLFKLMGILDCDTNWEKAAKIVVFSEFAKKVHQKLGVPPAKLEVVYPGIALEKSRGSKESRESKVQILFVGTWFERKGGPLLLEVFKKLAKVYKNIHLTIVGPVPRYVSINHPRIKQVDFVPREDLMRDYFPKADIFVIVPPKVEGFGFAVIEAMAHGLPSIVSNVCALPELVQDGKSGFVVRPGRVGDLKEKLEILIKSQTLRKKMGEAARKSFSQKFSVEKSNERLLEVYFG